MHRYFHFIRRKLADLSYPIANRLGSINRKQGDHIVITGSPRSGTTWLAEMINTVPGSGIMWEPLHLGQQKDLAGRGFTWRTFIDPDDRNPEYRQILGDILSGRRMDGHLGKYQSLGSLLTTRFWIIKFVRANNMLEYIARNFPTRVPILLVRHPCAVVSSQMHRRTRHQTVTRERTLENWSKGLPEIATQFLARYPEHRTYLESLDNWEEILAAVWCMDNMLLSGSSSAYSFIILSYEQLVSEGPEIMRPVMDYLNLEWTDRIAEQFESRSSTTVKGSHVERGKNLLEGWREKLNEREITRILGVVDHFDIDCYSRDLEPDYECLNTLTRYPI